MLGRAQLSLAGKAVTLALLSMLLGPEQDKRISVCRALAIPVLL